MKSMLESTVNVALLVTCGVVVWTFALKPSPEGTGSGPLKPPVEAVSLAGAETQGNPAARAALIVYSDFQCPYCSKFATDVLPALVDKYVKPGKVLLAFRNLPLDIHPQALPAAIAAECAGRQGKFWAVHDELFKNQTALKEKGVPALVEAYRLDGPAFDACVQAPETKQQIQADAAAAQKFGVRGTPTIFMGALSGTNVRVSTAMSGVKPGADPVEEYSKALDALVK
jgi:protein-disulfide isomerase